MMRPLIAFVLGSLLSSCDGSTPASPVSQATQADFLREAPTRILTDHELRSFRHLAPEDLPSRTGPHMVRIGKHNSVAVVAQYTCGDICPEYTKRVIRYEADPGQRCDRIGGVSIILGIPTSDSITPKPFCVPRPLVAGRCVHLYDPDAKAVRTAPSATPPSPSPCTQIPEF